MLSGVAVALAFGLGEPDRAMGGVPLPCCMEGIGDAKRAVRSARGTDPTTDCEAWSSAGSGDTGLESFLGREVMFAVVFGVETETGKERGAIRVASGKRLWLCEDD